MYEEIPGACGNPFVNRMTRLGGVSVLSLMTTPAKAYRWWYRDPLAKIMFTRTVACGTARASSAGATEVT